MNQDHGECRPHVRVTRAEDLAEVIDNMRQADVQEVLALGLCPEEAVVHGAQASDVLLTAADSSGKAVALFGTVPGRMPCGTPVGHVWLLGTDGMSRIRWEFLRQSKRWLQHLHQRHQVLFNRVDARNTLHIQWLRWLGFSMFDLKPVGVNGEKFWSLIRTTNHV